MEGSILTSPVPLGSSFGLKGKSKEWQMEMLMEKLRSKSSQYKSFYESSKALRMTMLEKRYPIDPTERSHLQKCLDTLQQNIKVTTLQAMIERLESVSRQLGLKFVTGPSGVDLFISSDMFYLEVNLDDLGDIKDVKIHHEGQGGQQSCEELVSCLSRRDFADFTAQLEGLASIYQLNADKKVKCKAFTSLTSLEIDLTVLASLHQYSKDPLDQVHRSPVGHLEKRRGGHPMKLTYFVSPYELLDPQSQNRPIKNLPCEGPLKVGAYASVCMESSSANKLQIQPLVTIGHGADGLPWPTYGSITPNNSITVAGSFVLTLSKPMPICVSLINSITAVTKAPCADLSTTYPLLSLICQHSANGMETHSSKGLFVNVDDQYHCYLMTESRGSLEGVVVSSIPFTHPSHVPEIISFLRRQAMFNCIISSCVRSSTKAVDFENMIMVEVSPLNWRQLTVSLEHPLEESMASVELDLTDPENIQVKVFTSSSSTGQYSELATKVFQRCLSIPVTMRTLIKQWNAASHQQQNRLMYNGGIGGSGVDPSGGGPGGGDRSDPRGDGPPDLLDPEVTVKMEPGLGGLGQNGSNVMPNYGEMLSDQPPSIPEPVFDASFSSPLDHDQALGGISFGEMSGKSGLGLGNSTDSPHKSRKKKRKAGDVGWHSPKRKTGEEGESSGDDESASLGTPTSREASDLRAGTPSSATSGMEFSALADLENSVSGITGEDKISDNELESVIMAATGELDDSNDVFKAKKKKRSEKERTANDILIDLENKNLVPPSVSITPIGCGGNPPNFGSVLSGMGLDRRPGIEIIPITTSPPAPVPTSITITPIPKSDERSKDRKKSRDGDKSGSKTNGGEKKRKRKREESPMGPPEKLPPKNDPLSKRVTVSIEPAESSPSSPVSAMRKFTSSPTGGSSTSSPLGVVPKGSPGTSKSSKSSHHSPKHSPAYSPKNNLISSPKPGSSSSAGSPKSSSSSVGKPSLTALKSTVSSPNKEKSKSSSSKSSSDKSDRKSPKIKTSSVKSSSRSSTSSPGGGPPTGGGDGGGGADSAQSGGARPPAPSGGSDLGKASSSNSTSSSSSSRNRKSSLSAIVDKLKSAQATDELSITPSRDKDVAKKDRDKKVALGTSTVELKPGTTPPPGASKVDGKTGEYMVKPSSDGIKITINKTKTRDKLTKEKTHTGLKPGVTSGPISKKPSSSSSGATKSGTSSGTSSSSSSYKKKPESLGSSGSKPAKDKVNKSSSSAVKDKPPPPSTTKKDNAVFTVVETGLGKSLDTKFQIPKLSARTSITEKKTLSLRNDENPPPSQSPSVLVHLASRLSPRHSPGVITEDELMDEAVVGGK